MTVVAGHSRVARAEAASHEQPATEGQPSTDEQPPGNAQAPMYAPPSASTPPPAYAPPPEYPPAPAYAPPPGYPPAPTYAPASQPPTNAQPTPRAQPVPEPQDPGGYGRRHSTTLGLSLGIGSGTGGTLYAGSAGFGYFVVAGVAPGADVSINGGGGVLTTETVTGTLRLVPVRTGQFAFFLIGRAGRLFISNHDDAWGAGGGAGVVIATGGNVGLQLSYEVLGLWPSSHCSDLASGCRLDAFGLGLIVGL